MKSLAWAPLLSMALLCGCVETHRASPVAYYTPSAPTYVAEPAPLSPTSESPVPRVYAPALPPDISTADVATADAIRHVLKDDPHLAGASQEVLITVKNGTIVLRGTAPSEHERIEIVQRVSRIPGVAHVRDHLGISDER